MALPKHFKNFLNGDMTFGMVKNLLTLCIIKKKYEKENRKIFTKYEIVEIDNVPKKHNKYSYISRR